MMSLVTFLLAGCLSLVLVWLLRASDPKLARAAKLNRMKLTPMMRATLAVGVFLPGAILLGIGHVGVFFNWLGTLTVIGWLIAVKRPRSAAPLP